MTKHPEWNDLRYFLEVARTGTISSAAKRLDVEHSTVSRRIDRLEECLGAVLFDRRRNGYTLTSAGQSLRPHAEQMENAMLGAVDESTAHSGDIVGPVRVGTPEAFGIEILASSLMQLREKQPRLHVEIMAQPQFPSLVTREVDLLVTLDPPEKGRYTKVRLAEVDYFLYGSRSYLENRPRIERLEDIADHEFVDYIHDGAVSERYRLLEELTLEPKRSFTSTSVLAQREAAAAGMGLVLLTPYVALGNPNLISVFPGKALITRTLWLAAPEDLFRIRRIRYVWDFIRELVSLRPDLFRH